MTVYLICIILLIIIGGTIGLFVFRHSTERDDDYADQRIELSDEELGHVSGGSATRQRLLSDKQSRAVWKRAFRIWQQTPHVVAPIQETEHECASCGTIYQGHYCPRCGQSSRIGRFSFKTAFLLFLDVWGLGNRGMFRSIRDLLLRPGYMIRDYVQGHQSAYFPPFKMFFILATLSAVIEGGFVGRTAQEPDGDINNINISANDVEKMGEDDKKLLEVTGFLSKKVKQFWALEDRNPAIFSFLLLFMVSLPLYLCLRRSPAIPDLRYSEHIVALTYTSNMYSLYSMIASVMPIGLLEIGVKLLAVIMFFVSLRQFTGYTKKRLLWYIFLTSLFILILFIIVLAVAALAYYLFK